eukprot:11114012-Alexandrium_andersonii.AAC.1
MLGAASSSLEQSLTLPFREGYRPPGPLTTLRRPPRSKTVWGSAAGVLPPEWPPLRALPRLQSPPAARPSAPASRSRSSSSARTALPANQLQTHTEKAHQSASNHRSPKARASALSPPPPRPSKNRLQRAR